MWPETLSRGACILPSLCFKELAVELEFDRCHDFHPRTLSIKKGDLKYGRCLLRSVFTVNFWTIFGFPFFISFLILSLPDSALERSAEFCKYSGEEEKKKCNSLFGSHGFCLRAWGRERMLICLLLTFCLRTKAFLTDRTYFFSFWAESQ